MGLKGVKLGPRSKVLEAREAAQRAADDQALLDAGVPEEIVYPPVPGPANPSTVRSCGCGKAHVPGGEPVTLDGVTHRYSAPCYSDTGDGRTYFDWRTYRTLEQRVADLERVVADLVTRTGGATRAP